MLSEQEHSMKVAAMFGHAPIDERKEELQQLNDQAKKIAGCGPASAESFPCAKEIGGRVVSMPVKFKYPADPFNPLNFARLPAEYNIHATEDQYNRMNQLGCRLKKNHPDWNNQKLMRKVFEAFPSVKISIPSNDNHERSISGIGEENTVNGQEENTGE